MKLLKPDGLVSLYGVIETYVNTILDRKLILPPGYQSWTQFGADFSNALRQARLSPVSWLTRKESTNYMLETSQWGLLVSEKAGGMNVTQALLAQSLEEFCGDVTTEKTFEVGVSELIATHVSYSGCAAVVHENTDDDELRVTWLWRTVALLYGALLESSEPLYNTTCVSVLLHASRLCVFFCWPGSIC